MTLMSLCRAMQVVMCLAQTPATPENGANTAKHPRIDASVHRGLTWLASQQRPDGSFPSHRIAQPVVSALGSLALLSGGYAAQDGPHVKVFQKAIDYVISCQKADGLLCLETPGPTLEREGTSSTGSYNHAIAGLMLAELYGDSANYRPGKLREAIKAAIDYTLRLQKRTKLRPGERGGWRYPARSPDSESDLSITSWQLMFLRSARNAGFNIPPQAINEAVGYVERSLTPRDTFAYTLSASQGEETSAMLGSGILSLSLAGRHETPGALRAGAKILARRVHSTFGEPRFYYNSFYCTQAMFQLGGSYWTQFYPPLAETLLQRQEPDGSWPLEAAFDALWGKCYSTAMAALCLTTPFQLLPVFQR